MRRDERPWTIINQHNINRSAHVCAIFWERLQVSKQDQRLKIKDQLRSPRVLSSRCRSSRTDDEDRARDGLSGMGKFIQYLLSFTLSGSNLV